MSEPAYPDALPQEYRLHWYVLERVLGQGGFGITYLARDTNLDQPVAIKEYLPIDVATRKPDSTVRPRADDQSDRYRWGLDRFIREARTLARFDHPNIVRVHSVFEFNNTAYMVMRFEEGENFAALLERRRTLPEPELLRVLLPVLDGLELIHNAGFIHRDIKPDNIHIRADGSPVLLDFGSARASLGQGRTVTILVAPGYAPFEQYYSSGENQGPWTDLYGLGATAYRAIAGVPPLDAITRSKGVLGSAREVLVPARTIGSGRYSEAVLRAIDHALEFAEKDRPQSIADWRRELRQEGAPPRSQERASAPPPVATTPVQAQPGAPFARRIAAAAAFAGVAALAGAIGAYFVMQNSKPPAPVAAVAQPEPVKPAPPPQSAPVASPPPAQSPEPDKSHGEKSTVADSPIKPAAMTTEPKPLPTAAPTDTQTKAKKPKAEPVKTAETMSKPPRKTGPDLDKPKPPPDSNQGGSVVAAVEPPKPALSPPPGDGPAHKYFLELANQGNGEAMVKLAETYESGRGTAQNYVWACLWYDRAARKNIAGAQTRREAVMPKLQPIERKQCQPSAGGQSASSG